MVLDVVVGFSVLPEFFVRVVSSSSYSDFVSMVGELLGVCGSCLESDLFRFALVLAGDGGVFEEGKMVAVYLVDNGLYNAGLDGCFMLVSGEVDELVDRVGFPKPPAVSNPLSSCIVAYTFIEFFRRVFSSSFRVE
jgi:hypothetical protein